MLRLSNLWRDLPPGPAGGVPHRVHVVVEIPKRSRNKVEYDPDAGIFRLDRVLHSPLYYPGDYGFVPQTMHDDGDPLDALVLVGEPSFAGCVIVARPVGVFRLVDCGEADDKLLCVPDTDPMYDGIHALADVPAHTLREIEHFFMVYKDLEQKKTESLGWGDLAAAHAEIERAQTLGLAALASPDHGDPASD